MWKNWFTLNNGSLGFGSSKITFLTSLCPKRPVANCTALDLVLWVSVYLN